MMKKVKLVIWLAALAFFGAHAQSDTKQQVNQPAAEDARITPADSAAAEAGQPVSDGEQDESTYDAQASNVEAVPQTTTSDSGSPAVLSGKNGKKRDGTNNVQRASMNMAGSPTKGLRVKESVTADRARTKTQKPEPKAAGTKASEDAVVDNSGQPSEETKKTKRKKRRNRN